MEIEMTAAENEKCTQTVAEKIQDGEIPISAGGNEEAWSAENPFRNIDAANKEVPTPKEPEP